MFAMLSVFCLLEYYYLSAGNHPQPYLLATEFLYLQWFLGSGGRLIIMEKQRFLRRPVKCNRHASCLT